MSSTDEQTRGDGATPPVTRYISLETAANQLECSIRTLRRLIESGDLPAFRAGKRLLRVRANDIEAMLQPVPKADFYA